MGNAIAESRSFFESYLPMIGERWPIFRCENDSINSLVHNHKFVNEKMKYIVKITKEFLLPFGTRMVFDFPPFEPKKGENGLFAV